MDILIVAHFTQSVSEGGNNRFNYLAKLLSEDKSNDVELLTSSFFHTKKSHRERNYSHENIDGYKTTMIEEPGYPKNVCLKRFYSHWIMSKNLKKYLEKRKKPDVIYCAIPSLDVAKVAAKYAKDNGIRFIIDVQDLWPEAFKMVLKVPILSDIIFAPMNYMANYIYKQADEIIAVSDTYCKRAMKVNNKCKESHTVFLGTELSTFDKNVQENPVELDKTYFNIGYCGTLGHSYDIKCVIDAMDFLKREKAIENIKFIVMGDGPLKQEFEKYANDKDVNVEFAGRLEYPKMCGMLSACDVAVNPISHGAAQSIINKHADYAASGIPVISTQECEEYRRLVEEYGMGVNCDNGHINQIADAIERLMNDADVRKQMGNNTRKCAEDRFNRKESYKRIIRIIQKKTFIQ